MGKMTNEDKELFVKCVEELSAHTNFTELKKYKHHHNTSTYIHSIWVAYLSFYISRALKLKVDPETIIYGALLHDYYLYDCHEDGVEKHLTKHPLLAAANANRDWGINKIQENIITRHMFPITPIPPKYKESIIVNMADKLCALYECTSKRPYQKRKLSLMLAHCYTV